MTMDIATKMAKATKEELVATSQDTRVRDILLVTKTLVSQVGKEEARKLIGKAQYDIYYKLGREAAERLGNPQDLDSYIEEYWVKFLDRRPLVPPTAFVERTKNRAVCRTTSCVLYDAWRKIAGDPNMRARYGKDTFEAAKGRCDHDLAWANGFNSNIKLERTNFFLDGDDCCEFVVEL